VKAKPEGAAHKRKIKKKRVRILLDVRADESWEERLAKRQKSKEPSSKRVEVGLVPVGFPRVVLPK